MDGWVDKKKNRDYSQCYSGKRSDIDGIYT